MINLLIVLATWRITKLFVDEDGPFDVFAKLRYKAGVREDQFGNRYAVNKLAEGLTCIWCTSIWFSFFASFFSEYSVNIHTFLIVWLAISAAVIFFDEFVEMLTRICNSPN